MIYLTQSTTYGSINKNQKIMGVKKMFKLINIIKNLLHKRKQKKIFMYNTVNMLKKKYKID